MRFGRIVFLSAFLTIAANAQKISVEFDEAQDFSDFKTFTILPGQIHSKNPSLNNPIIMKKIEADIRKFLLAKGMEEVTKGPHDLNVRYSLGSGIRREVDHYPAGWRGYGTRTVVVNHNQETLIIDLNWTKSRSLIWRAIAVQEKDDPLKLKDKLDDMVRKSLEKYPPKVK